METFRLDGKKRFVKAETGRLRVDKGEGGGARVAVTHAQQRAKEGDLLVVSEVVLTAKGFAAYVAGERPLVRVRPLVYEEVVALSEVTRAVLADELFLRPRRPTRHSEEPPVEDARQQGVIYP